MTIARHDCFDVYWTLGRHDSKKTTDVYYTVCKKTLFMCLCALKR